MNRQPFVFEVPEQNWGKLVEKFTKMTRRARKCKATAPTFKVIHEQDITYTKKDEITGFETERIVHYYYVVVDGIKPHISGWDFIATVDHTEQGGDGLGNVIKAVPGVTSVPVKYRKAQPLCDHCKQFRRRNETFIIRSEDKLTHKQIGRNCLQDFFEGESAEDIAQVLEWWHEAAELANGSQDEDFFGGGYNRKYERYEIESVLTVTQAAIEEFGWLSRSKAKELGGFATADRVEKVFTPKNMLSKQDEKDNAKIADRLKDNEESYKNVIVKALEWIRNQSPEESEDYLYNLWVITRGETVRIDRLGLACSLLPAYRRYVDSQARKAKAESEPSEFVGTIGKRQVFTDVVVHHISEPWANEWGTTQRVMFKQDFNLLIWYATGIVANDWVVGTTYNICCTPKQHKEAFNKFTQVNEKQTIINRVKEASVSDKKKYK